MKNAIIIHGTTVAEEYYTDKYPSLSNSHWLPWLQKQLLMKDIPAVTPEMFKAHEPDYDYWKQEVERFDINEETILVGHSCGGGFLVRYLSETDIKVGKVVLVAPWLDPNNRKDGDFFDFTIDENLVMKTDGVAIFNSDDDDEEIQTSVKTIVDTVKNIKLVEFTGYGHFIIGHMKTEKFPELLEEVLS